MVSDKLLNVSDRIERTWNVLFLLVDYCGLLIELHPESRSELSDNMNTREQLESWLRQSLTTVAELEKKCAEFKIAQRN